MKMTFKAKRYVIAVIGLGLTVLAASLSDAATPSVALVAYVLMAAAASAVKMRLPGIEGTYSLNFLFVLVGIAYLDLVTTLAAGCLGAMMQSVWHAKKAPTHLQLAFNVASIAISIGLSHIAAHSVNPGGDPIYRPIAIAVAATVFFVSNTCLISGVLSLMQGIPLAEVCGRWYLWSFPYYLVGAAMVGLLPTKGVQMSLESWLILGPLLYLVHFYFGLTAGLHGDAGPGAQRSAGSPLAPGARLYIGAMVSAGTILLAAAFSRWESAATLQFLAYLFAGLVASGWKVHIPKLSGTISAGSILLLMAIVDLHYSQIVLIGAAMGVMQCVWKAKKRPRAIQVVFNAAVLTASAALAYFTCRVVLRGPLTGSIAGPIAVAVVVLYGCNTLLVAAVMCLVESRPMSLIWQQCHFWSFPLYLVGATAAGLMIASSRSVGWRPSLLVLPLALMCYVSYRLQVQRATQEVLCAGN